MNLSTRIGQGISFRIFERKLSSVNIYTLNTRDDFFLSRWVQNDNGLDIIYGQMTSVYTLATSYYRFYYFAFGLNGEK